MGRDFFNISAQDKVVKNIFFVYDSDPTKEHFSGGNITKIAPKTLAIFQKILLENLIVYMTRSDQINHFAGEANLNQKFGLTHDIPSL